MLRIILRCPWPFHVVVGLIFLGLAAFAFQVLTDVEAEKAQALQQGVPEAVSLNAFDPERDVHPADEVHVVGWINFDHNYQLTETRKRKVSSYDVTRRMFVLFGPDDEMGSRMARAVVLLDDGAVDRFQAEAMAGFVELRDERLIFRLNGTAERSPELYKMANDALKKEGLTKAPGFQFIEIWGPKGREHDLQPSGDGPIKFAGVIAGIGVAFLLIAVWRFRVPYAGPGAVPGQRAAMPHEIPAAPRGKARKGLVLKVGAAVVAFAVIGALGHLDKVLALLPLLIIAAVYLGMRQMGRAVGAGIGRAFGRPPEAKAEPPEKPALPAWAMVARQSGASPDPVPRALDNGPVESVPTLGARVSGVASAGPLRKWMPFAAALVFVFLAPKLMDHFGIGLVVPIGPQSSAPVVAAPMATVAKAPAPEGVLATEAAAPVPVVAAEPVPAPVAEPVPAPAVEPVPAPAAVQEGRSVSDGLAGLTAALRGGLAPILALIALGMLVLGGKVYIDRRSSRAIAAEPIARWEKIALQARAGRGLA